MSHIFSYQFRRWSLTFALLSSLTVLSVCLAGGPDKSSEPSFESPESLFQGPSVEASTESRLQSKGERILESLGEQTPVVLVTATVTYDSKVTKDLSYDKDEPVTESMQETSESLSKGESPYAQHKRAVNYKVGERHVTTTSFGPRVEKIDCLAVVSSQNESRCREIEQALGVALGLDTARGDRVQVIVK